MSRKIQLEAAYKGVVGEISKICETLNRAQPTLVAVSKYKSVEDIEVLYALGQRHFGENYVQEITEKAKKLPSDIKWHFIGNLQSNKTKIAREIPNLFAVETVDSASKATKLSNQRAQLEAPQDLEVWIQVNTSGEDQKAGVMPDLMELTELAEHVQQLPHVKLRGLMTIGSLVESEKAEGINKDFKLLSDLRDSLQRSLNIELGLSMGMSHDFVAAIKQGSTNVRVGSSIFGVRQVKEEIKAQK